MYPTASHDGNTKHRLGEVLTMKLSASKFNLAQCREVIEKRAEAAGFDSGDLWGIVSAVFEACVNAVTHGNGTGKHSADLSIHTYPDRLVVIVKDHGHGFVCPTETPMPPVTSQRGRGIPLMKAFMDEVRFENDNGCKVTLIKYLHRRIAN